MTKTEINPNVSKYFENAQQTRTIQENQKYAVDKYISTNSKKLLLDIYYCDSYNGLNNAYKYNIIDIYESITLS